MMGSPKYMSPEQVGGHAVDHRSDVFSLGSLLYEMVAGVPAFEGENLGQLLTAILHATPVPPGQFRPGIPPALEAAIARAMQKNSQARYQDAADMARDLAQCRAAMPRTRPAAGAAAAVAPGMNDSWGATATVPAAEAARTAAAAAGLPVSLRFDSSEGLNHLRAGRGSGEASAVRPLHRDGHRLAWIAAYAVAGAVALALALSG
jgi:serine/threonine-protein kinase